MKKEEKKQQTEAPHKGNAAFCYQIGMVNILINHEIEIEIEVEILTTSITYQIPHSPQWYRGMTSLRGDILPVVNMHFLLGIKQKQNPNATKQTLLKLKHPDFPALVIMIDGLPYQTDISELATHNITNTLKAYPSWVKSSAEYNNKLYLFADYTHLFSALQQNDQEQLVMPTTQETIPNNPM
jgi:chemotaxis signal transduction protein